MRGDIFFGFILYAYYMYEDLARNFVLDINARGSCKKLQASLARAGFSRPWVDSKARAGSKTRAGLETPEARMSLEARRGLNARTRGKSSKKLTGSQGGAVPNTHI